MKVLLSTLFWVVTAQSAFAQVYWSPCRQKFYVGGPCACHNLILQFYFPKGPDKDVTQYRWVYNKFYTDLMWVQGQVDQISYLQNFGIINYPQYLAALEKQKGYEKMGKYEQEKRRRQQSSFIKPLQLGIPKEKK